MAKGNPYGQQWKPPNNGAFLHHGRSPERPDNGTFQLRQEAGRQQQRPVQRPRPTRPPQQRPVQRQPVGRDPRQQQRGGYGGGYQPQRGGYGGGYGGWPGGWLPYQPQSRYQAMYNRQRDPFQYEVGFGMQRQQQELRQQRAGSHRAPQVPGWLQGRPQYSSY